MLAAWLGPEPALGGKEFYMYHQYSFSEMPVMMINRSVQGAKGDFFLLLGLDRKQCWVETDYIELLWKRS